MCYMIVVALPRRWEQKWLSRLPDGMNFWPSYYQELPSKMGNFTPHIIGTVWCSCDLFSHGATDRTHRLRKRYEKQGWSETKIKRALEKHRRSGFQGGLHPELRCWLADAAGDAKDIYLFVHWDSKNIAIAEEVRISASLMREETYRIREEELIHILSRSQV